MKPDLHTQAPVPPNVALTVRATPVSYLDTQVLLAARGGSELMQPPIRPIRFDVRLVSDGMFPRTNVPRTVYAFERVGYGWGGKASAASHELAINILNLFAPPFSDGRDAVTVRQGSVSVLANDLAFAFAEQFLTQPGDAILSSKDITQLVQRMAPASLARRIVA